MQSWRSQEPGQHTKIVALLSAKQRNAKHRRLGALLGEARRDAGVTYKRIAEEFKKYASKEVLSELGLYWPKHLGNIPPLSDKQYGKIERNEKPPWFSQILSLYLAMTAGCGIEFTPEERSELVELAQQRIEAKTGQYREKLTEPDWQWLKEQLCKADGHDDATYDEADGEIEETARETLQEIRRQQEERRRLLGQLVQDTSHVIGRDKYCAHLLLLTSPTSSPRKKAIFISAMTGVGKSSVFKLLYKQLLAAQDENASTIIMCELQTDKDSSTAQDWFDRFLARIYSVLETKQKEMASLPPVDKRIQRTLQAIGDHHKPLVILLDDAHRLIEPDGDWCSEWKQFLSELAKSSDHQATLYVATREWPIWQERETAGYFHHEELPAISAEIGIQLWHQFGFFNEQEEILRKATELCGYNPRMMELVAQCINAPDFTFGWDDDILQGGMARFVEHPHLARVTPLLEDIIGRTLSEEAKHLLKILAFAPVPLPPPLALHVAPDARQSIHELVRASLLAKRLDRLVLLPLVAEAIFEHTSREEKQALEQLLMDAYQYWLQAGKFHEEAEQAVVTADLIILYLQQYRLTDAAELLIQSGWLCYQFGHGTRLARICQGVLAHYNWKSSQELEMAAHILYDRLAAFRGEEVTTAERAKRYQTCYQQAQAARIQLPATIVVHLLQPIITYLADEAQFVEAEALLEAHHAQLAPVKKRDPITYSTYLYYRAYLLARWGEHELPQFLVVEDSANDHIPPQAKGRIETALRFYQECVDLLRESLRGASPLQGSRAIYKLARRLNNYAYYARMIHADPISIQLALKECIKLEKRGYTNPGSLQVAYGEYAQFLTTLGDYQDALHFSDLAIEEADKTAQSGYAWAEQERAVLLVERGEIYLLLGELDGARQLFIEALSHLENNKRRENYYRKALIHLQTITFLETTLKRKRGEALSGQLDWRWLPAYNKINECEVSFWLSQSGPLTPDEQNQWNTYTEHGNIDALQDLMEKALERELEVAVAEQRSPRIFYPAIPIKVITRKIEDCLALKQQIEREEANIIVKNFYRDALDEQLHMFQMFEAIQQGNTEGFVYHNQCMYAQPSPPEMEFALHELFKLIEQGMQRKETKPLSQQLQNMLQSSAFLSSVPNISETEGGLQWSRSRSNSPILLQLMQEKQTIPVKEAALFLEHCLRLYSFSDWRISIEKGSTSAFVESNVKKLVLPERDLTPARLLNLLAHELECHVFRHANGMRSKLSLLGPGLAHYSAIEEALAVRYTAQVEGKDVEFHWLGTLAVGLACGISSVPGLKAKPLSFYELYCFMYAYHLLKQLLQGKERNTAQKNAHQFALRRCRRTFEGIPNLDQPGYCSAQDHSYLHGSLRLQSFLEAANADDVVERLSVGCISLEHLEDCAQLGIVKPAIAHKQLAMQDHILQMILQIARK